MCRSLTKFLVMYQWCSLVQLVTIHHRTVHNVLCAFLGFACLLNKIKISMLGIILFVSLSSKLGLVDAHTHPVWAGDRVHEFAMKVNLYN